MRKSTVTKNADSAGKYEIEIFEARNPKYVVVCSHGNGVRRWDGEHFFHNVAEYYPTVTFYLVDQNQVYEDGCKLNSLPVMVRRVQDVLALAKKSNPQAKLVVLAHSMGCGIASRLNLEGVQKVIFVTPGAGNERQRMIKRYGEKIAKGQIVKTGDGLTKFITKEFFETAAPVTWEEEYQSMLGRYKNVYTFEAGDEEIVGEDRFKHREMPFASYEILPGATHNLHGHALQLFFEKLDTLLA